MKNIGLYKENKKAKVGTIIECPICHTKFKKIQYSQAFCCTICKDKFHNGICSNRHKDINYYEHYNEMNHDLIHCDGFECPLKERCVRYKAHLDLKENQYNGSYDYYIINPYDKKTKQCKQIKIE